MKINVLKKQDFQALLSCISVLNRKDRVKLVFVSIIQITLSFLDLLGVALIGVLGALAVNGVQSKPAGNRVASVLNQLNIEDYTFQNQVAILAILAAIILVFKTVANVYLTRKVMFFLSRRGAMISGELAEKLLNENLLSIQEKSTQDTVYALTGGVTSITMGVLSTAAGMLADAALLVILFVGLVVIDPRVALSTLIIFALIGYILYWLQQKRAKHLGRLLSELNIQSNEKILEVLSSYRELVVRNRRQFYANEIYRLREKLADAQAEISFLPQVSKYVIETTVILGTVVISGVQFLLQDASHAVATLTVFLAAGSRIAPAVLRFQQGAISIKSNIAASEPTLNMLDKLRGIISLEKVDNKIDFAHSGFNPKITLTDVSFTYPGAEHPALNKINLTLEEGMFIAVVGPSGAGKTTLVDILLGILEPASGLVQISNQKPSQAMSLWPGAVGYVPQDVLIVNGSIRDNVALGYPDEDKFEEEIVEALEIASLGEFLQQSEEGTSHQVGERGSRLSGGQRQRLGIARALYTKPRILVLDEATSSLDGAIESEITETIKKMRGKTTVITIAHRLSTVREADTVIYMEAGAVIFQGTFEKVRENIPSFDHQASLMGL
jgi:ABC-type multidrug transport system fused ATPase/permease subunit